MSIVNEYLADIAIRDGDSLVNSRRDLRSARRINFPIVIGARRFDNQSEYDEALHDFLNSN